ncbi:PAN domain protein [Candidatus Rhodobacter oscarellae]|uniref:PAN domain protein n=1 Tax=Candidatus Rhodobacter oscarellae TaxID=1675527 RepID=A0A0J9E870_9RHOB|nr:alpha-2-macroglobulin family protein [Candidatus Rhodobacter lobularis]KMW58935.1 PAN domain protein [Candidatus Rhodobacter lobularis]
MRFALCFLAVFATFCTGALAEGLIPERRLALVRDVDFPGGDIQSIFDTTLNACEQACLANSRCAAFTYNTRSNSCFPKSEYGESAAYEGAFSGIVLVTDPAIVARGAQREGDLDFLREGDLNAAREMALDLTNKHVPNDWTAAQLLQSATEARTNGNIVAAYRFTGAATVLSDAADHWVEYGRLALAIETEKSSEQRSYQGRAVSAAVNGYLRAGSPAIQANALLVLADALQKRGRGGDSIPALRLALDLAPRQDTEEQLDKAIGKFGFRVTSHSVDYNAARPRICAEFNENLVRVGVDYAPFLQLPSAELTVEAEQRRLCIEGVEHGKRYQVTFREGLPAASGETLAKNIELSMYVRDRSPSVRFPGRAYVLPAMGEVALPIETVNVTEVELLLRRVSDRSILRAIQDDYFGRPLSKWEEDNFGNDIATEVWSGVGEVQQELNKDVATRLPMTEVVGALEPGIYALQAKVPGADPYDNPAATQWFVVSDLGLATMQGEDGLHVFLRALSSADPLAGTEITLLSRSNDVLATATTDVMGYAVFEPGLTRGTGGASPAMVLARTESDITFLSLTDPEFDLSDRGVEGRAPAGAIDTFITTDRGAYRAGETIHATVLTRDATTEAIEGLPLTAILKRPDGVEYSRALSQNEVAGGHVFAFRTTGTAPRGSWRLDIHTDVDAPSVASAKVLVEDFLPERIDFDLELPKSTLKQDEVANIGVDVRYLFGAPGGDLPVEGELLLRATDTLEAYPGYRFGRYDSSVSPEVYYFPSDIRTDASGRATIGAEFPQLETNFRPLEAIIAVRVSEGSGRPVERKITAPVAPNGPVIGIKPNFDGTLAESTEASFNLIALDEAQQKTEMPVRWTINRVQTRYQWYQYSGYWNWEPITTRQRIAEGDAMLGSDPVTVAAPVEWGRYEIKVERTGGEYIAASSDFYAGWYGGTDASATPDLLEVSLDAEDYRPGDTARLRLVPRYAGKALVTVMSNRLIAMKAVEVAEGENLVELPVTDEWGAGAYVTATVIRPMDAAAGRNPARSLGLSYAPVDPGARKLSAVFETETEVDPRGPLPVAVKVDGVAEGEAAYVTIAVVDVGILNLTGFDAPDPSSHYFGQRKLGMGMRDVYGRLIDGLNGAMGQVRSGGDASPQAGLQSPPPTEELVAYFSGPIPLGPDGYARTEFQLPSFNGTVKLMAVAWSKTAVGEAAADVLVRDPVVLTASLPRFLAPGDTSRMLLEIVHASGPAGRIGLDVQAQGVRLNRAVPSGLNLAEQEKQVLSIPITAVTAGLHKIDVTLATPGGKVLTKTLNLPVQVNDPITARTSRFSLAAGDTFTFDSNVFAGLQMGTGSATLAAGPIARLDAPGLLEALDRYPYGCTEQITSRAMPLLYLDDIARAMGLAERETLATRIDQSIERILTNQASNGGFGLWRASSGDLWLDAYVTDFLSRAKAQGYAVPDIAFRTALDNLRNRVNYSADFDIGGEDIAYALYVLAREGAASIGDLRYYADVKGTGFGSPLASAQIGAALAAYGDPTRADRMFGIAGKQIRGELARPKRGSVWRSDYGTTLRDRAAVLTLAVEAGSNAVDQSALLDSIAPVQGANSRSTQEQVWTLLAAHAMLDRGSFGNLTVNGAAADGPLVRVVEDDTAFSALAIQNTGTQAETITLTTFGVPEVPEPAGGKGYAIERRYFTLEGDPVSPESVKQGDRMVTVLTVKPFGKTEARLMIDDPLPGGFEIDNPNLLRGGDIGALDWLELHTNTRNTEFRQERFLAAVDWRSDKSFRLGYIVRAVSPGTFHHPAASVEDMYRPEFRAQTDAARVTITE